MVNTISRLDVDAICYIKVIDFLDIARLQSDGSDYAACKQNSSLLLKFVPKPHSDSIISCDALTGTHRPFVPIVCRKNIFDCLYLLSHPRIQATVRLMAESFVSPKMNSNLKQLTGNCLHC